MIEHLQRLYTELKQYWDYQPGVLELLIGLLGKPKKPVIQGLYFWGGVGRGKTYLMDLFFHCLPGERKMRMHFHRFMQMIHTELHLHRGKTDPLKIIAQGMAQRTDIICFDEFYVSDIGDAMILANLLDPLFSLGVILVATSNIEPVRLYENGLQRKKFLPAITLLETHCKVLHVDGGLDYRLRSLEKAEIYHFPLGSAAESAMADCFQNLSAGLATEENILLEILGRHIKARSWAEGLVWFEFEDICGGPRSAADYIEIARLCHTVLISNVPVLDSSVDDIARRFISLVDEFYDHNVKLVISALSPLELIYAGSELTFAFERTRSRLQEMQSHGYLAREHDPG